MKLFGEKIEGPNEELIILPRSGRKDLIFKVRAILSTDAFEKLCPQPEPPNLLKPGGKKVPDVNDKIFKIKFAEWVSKRTAWMVITSLSATDGLTWEKS